MQTAQPNLTGSTRLHQLRKLAETRFSKWREKHANKLRRKKTRDTANLSPLGQAAHRLKEETKRLEREVRKRSAFHLEVAQENDCPELLSANELDRLKTEMTAWMGAAVSALQHCNENEFFAAGNVAPAAAQAAQDRVALHIPAQITSVIVAELGALKAEGEAMQQQQAPLKSAAIATRNRPLKTGRRKVYKTVPGRNIDRLRKECGWSFDGLATAMELDKTTVLRHVNKGMYPSPDTLKSYADAFSERLGRTITVAELEQ